jgi:hypothetical protein
LLLLVALLFPLVILLIGTPVALFVRLLIEIMLDRPVTLQAEQ